MERLPEEEPLSAADGGAFASSRRHSFCCCYPRFVPPSPSSWWRRGLAALRKVREWSELVAGPRWKTFIRRFNKNGAGNPRGTRFQYDPLSYALNFDDGPNDDEEDGIVLRRAFSAKFVAPPMAAGDQAA